MRTHRKIGIIALVGGTALTGLLSGITVGVLFAVMQDLPQIRELENFEPSAISRIYSSDNALLAELFTEKRTPIPIGQIPEDLKSALIVTEDRKFYSHSGIDLKAILRAIVKDLMAGEFVEGASTITQQLAKTLFLTPEKRLLRKIKEALLAIQLERRYTKDEILALYLNQIYLGSGAYGVQAASQRYFGIPASQMRLSQCALIAGLPKAPSRYSPLVHPDLAEKRRNLVLKMMRERDLITRVAYLQALAEPVLAKRRAPLAGKASSFIAYIKPQLEKAVGPSLLYKGGLTIHTTLSYRYQRAAENAVKKGVLALQQRQTRRGGEPENVQGALVALRVDTGGIVAMVGGSRTSQGARNRAVGVRRQSGSAFKPILFALAVTQGFTQSSLLLDAPVVFRGGANRADWHPENISGRYEGELTLRRSLTHSKNIPAVRLAERLGPTALVDFAHKVGIQSPLAPNLTIALGSAGTTLLEMTAAYATFANRGNHIPPFGIAKILDRDGETIWRPTPVVRPAMTPAQAAILVDMLRGVVLEGTAVNAAALGFSVAGKTGTTNDNKDALFIGFSPETATGVWVGRDDGSSLGEKETGARAALPIWVDFMGAAHNEASRKAFFRPERTVYKWIDPFTGQVKNEGAERAVNALFIRQPTKSKE